MLKLNGQPHWQLRDEYDDVLYVSKHQDRAHYKNILWIITTDYHLPARKNIFSHHKWNT